MRLALLLLFACTSAPEGAVLAPGTAVPPPDDATLAQVDAADGVPRDNPLLGGWVDGRPVRYWAAGTATSEAMNGWLPCRREGRSCIPIDHPMVVDALPGEAGYSPFIALWLAPITDDWTGEVLPEAASFRTAARRGIIETPFESFLYVNCPIVHPDTTFESIDALSPIYVRGMQASCAHFGRGRDRLDYGALVLESDRVLVRNIYVLTREGEDGPLAEPLRMEDMNGDGDQLDSNNVLGADLGDDDYTPLWQPVMVTVPAETPSFDDSEPSIVMDTTLFDVDEATYDITPRPIVVDYGFADELVNCPIFPE